MSKWTIDQIKNIVFEKNNIPEELKNLKQWVSWGGSINEDGSPNKVPINPKTNTNASSTNPDHWGTFEEAINCRQIHKRYGIGFVFSKDDDYIGIDIDDCIVEGQISKEAMEIIDLFSSYTEYSPSGNGIHILIKGDLPGNKGRKDPKKNIEIYKLSRYFTTTGDRINNNNIVKCQASIDAFMKSFFPPEKINHSDKIDLIKRSSMDDLAIIEKVKADPCMRQLWEGDTSAYESPSEADLALCGALSFWTQKDTHKINILFRMSGLYREKWDREGYKVATIDKVTSSGKAYDPNYYKDKEPKLKVILPDKIAQIRNDVIFPKHCMAGLAKEFSDLYGKSIEVPEEFMYFGFLTCLGSILADKISLNLEVYPQPRMYTVFLGESASERKSTALKKLIGFFTNDKGLTENGEINAFDESMVTWGVNSAEGLGTKLELGNKIVLCYDELKHFTKKSDVKAAVLLPCVGTLFENNRYTAITKNKSIEIENAYVSMVAASTIETYDKMFDDAFTDIGFVNRLFIVPGKATKKYPLPVPVDREDLNALKAKVLSLFWNIGNYTTLSIDKNAEDLYKDWYNKLEGSIHSKRLDTYAMKLMMLLSINEFKYTVDFDIMKKVIEISDWQLAVRKLHDPIDADNSLANMEQRIRRTMNTNGYLTEREMKRNLVNTIKRMGISVFERALKNLMSNKEIVGLLEGKTQRYWLVREDDE